MDNGCVDCIYYGQYRTIIYIYIYKYVPHIMNIRMEPDHHQLIMPPISKNGSNTFLERSIMYTAQCEWNKLSEHIRTILIAS